jgi:hypothetical protein
VRDRAGYSVTFRIPSSGMRTLLKRIKPLMTAENAAAVWWRAYKASDNELDAAWRKQLKNLYYSKRLHCRPCTWTLDWKALAQSSKTQNFLRNTSISSISDATDFSTS